MTGEGIEPCTNEGRWFESRYGDIETFSPISSFFVVVWSLVFRSKYRSLHSSEGTVSLSVTPTEITEDSKAKIAANFPLIIWGLGANFG